MRLNEANILGVGMILIIGAVVLSFSSSFSKTDDKDGEGALEQEDTSDIQTILPQELSSTLPSNDAPMVVDIREVYDFSDRHIIGSVNIPLRSPDFSSLSAKSIVVVGYGDQTKSTRGAASAIAKRGATVSILSGGFEAWEQMHFPFISAGDPSSFVDQSKVTYTTPEEAKKRIAENGALVLLDVRPAAEFSAGHLENSKNIPLAQLEFRRGDIPVGKEILVYGESALQSFQAGVRLFDLGFIRTLTLQGGYGNIQ